MVYDAPLRGRTKGADIMTRRTTWTKTVAAIGASLAFIYAFPRILVNRLGEANPWTSYLYLYGFGLWFFLIGIWLIRTSGACRPGRGRDGFWFGVLIGGFVFFALLHAVWIIAALNIPFKGSL